MYDTRYTYCLQPREYGLSCPEMKVREHSLSHQPQVTATSRTHSRAPSSAKLRTNNLHTRKTASVCYLPRTPSPFLPPHHLASHPNMPTKTPTTSDFPQLTVTITPAPSPSPTPAPNILLLLHGLGDTAAAFTKFAQALRLPETTIITIQGTAPLPFDLGGFHWGDDVSFDSATGALDMDAGLTRSTKILTDLVRSTLVQKCGYALREIMALGFGQGGMAALALARELGLKDGSEAAQIGALSGVISIGAPYALSGSRTGDKSRSPVLLVAGRDSVAVSDEAVRRTKQVFEFVEVSRYARRGDGMPGSREEMLPVMQFFARRLRSRQGVPEGSVEIS